MAIPVVGNKALKATYKIRMSREDKAWIRQQAEVSGMSMAKFIRQRALGIVIVSKADLAVLAELRRIGGLLKHTITKLSTNGEGEMIQTMNVLRAYVKGMTHDRKEDR